MAGIILFNKPFNVLSQFTDDRGRATLADYFSAPGYRVAGHSFYQICVRTRNGGMYDAGSGVPDKHTAAKLAAGMARHVGL